MDPRIATLTKRERELLRHVFLGRTSTEIAHLETMNEKAVSNRIDAARAKLGGVTRRQAAQLLAEAERWVVEKIHPPEIHLPPAPVPPADGAVSNTGEQRQVDTALGVLEREDAAFYEPSTPDRFAPTPQPGRPQRHDGYERLGMILSRAALLVALTIAFLWVYGRNL
jgi:DNA-binding CsgD family transcriptional regulator